MRKITFLFFALVCASMTAWAVDWSGIGWIGSTDATYDNQFKVSGKDVVNIQNPFGTGIGIYITFPTDVNLECTAPAEASYQKQGAAILFFLSMFDKKETNVSVSYNGGSVDFVIYNDKGVDPAPSKPSPELSLNATSITLEKDVTAETFQIVPTKTAGSGDISYSSNAEGVATVSNTGLVTAVGPGTATITVSVAENEDFAADSKTLTVEVIDWTSIAWLTNSNDSYKLYISPAMGGDGQRIEGSNLWVGFPSAELGAMSIVPSGGEGAWRTFALSNFPGYRNQFTVVCQGTTYTFTVYRNFTGVNLAKGMPSTAGRDASNAWQSNDGNKGTRWGSAGAKHYAAVGDAAEDWWVVDLGAMYEINAIKTLYEGATPKNYSFYTSPNNDSWIEIDSYNAVPQHVGNTDADYNEYTYSPGKVGRYVKIFAREAVQSDFAYGISIWEFEVYGQPAENVDINAPVLASAAVSGTPTTSEIKIAVSASDTEDGEISLYRVRESSLKMDRNFTAVDGKLTFSGLVDDTDYSFTITALDNIGNQSNAIVVNASTAVDPSNPATMAPEPPARSADDVRAIYSDAYADILMHDFMPGNQWGAAAAERRVKSGNNYLLYDISSNNNITWGMNDDGVNAIVAKDGYHAVGTTGLDASGMEYLHVDIWSLVALKKVNVKINDAVFTTITHDGGGWQSYDLEMTGSAVDFTNIRWLKLDEITSDVTRGKAAVDNYYFWKAASGVKTVVVSSNNGSWGSATAKVADEDVTSVPTGTEVTFAAAAETGYDFAYWQIGETKVYDNPYVVAVDANITVVATFEPHRTTYCRSVITADNGATIYMTAKKTGAVQEGTGYPQYRLEFEGMAGYAITGPGNFDVWIGHVNGSSGNTQFANGAWTFVDNTSLYPYGMLYAEFYAEDWREITFPNHYFFFAPGGVATLNTNFPTASLINWNNSCIDETAPVLAAPAAEALNESTIRLSISAKDDYSNTIWYHITCAAASIDETITDASGVTITKEYTGLTSGTFYEFTVTAADGSDPATANVSAPQVCSATPAGDTEAPEITNFTATPSYGYVDLTMTATDDMGHNLTFTITYGTENAEVEGAPGVAVTKRIYATPGTAYTFSVVATDAASHTSNVANANATTLTIPAAPTPTHDARLVYSIYSDAYTPVVAQDFWRSNYGGVAPLSENDYLLYRMTNNMIVWGNADQTGSIHPTDEFYTDGEHFGLDVSNMAYLHFDVWCDVADQLNTVNINDQAVTIPTTRTIAGEWVSFDVDITGVALTDRQNVRWLKFHPFNTVNCIAAIDNVYFWSYGTQTTPVMGGDAATGGWATFASPVKVAVPDGVTAYKATYSNEGGDEQLVLDAVSGAIPANEGVLLRGEADHVYTFSPTNDDAGDYAGNALKGCPVRTDITSVAATNDIFCLRYSELYSLTGFFIYSGQYIAAGKAYLPLPKAEPSSAPRRIRFVFREEQGTTGFDPTNAEAVPTTKFIENGQLYIRRGDAVYTIQGVRVK